MHQTHQESVSIPATKGKNLVKGNCAGMAATLLLHLCNLQHISRPLYVMAQATGQLRQQCDLMKILSSLHCYVQQIAQVR